MRNLLSSSPEQIVVYRDYSEMPGPAEQSDGAGFGSLQETDMANAMVSVYERHLFVNSCVFWIAGNLPKGVLRFAKRGSDKQTIIDDHPVVNAFNYWNPYASERESWEFLASFLMLTGMGYVVTTPPSMNAPKDIAFELYPLLTQGVRVVRSSEGLVGYEYIISGEEQRYIPQEVWATRCFNPRDRFLGSGRLAAGALEVSTDLAARKWNKQLLDKGVHISGTLESDDDLAPENAELIRKTFERKYSGTNAASRVAVLWSGLKFNPHTLAHKDIAWIEQLQMGREDIATAFQLPLEVLGMKAANFATLQQKHKIAWETVLGWAERFEDSLNSNFLPIHAPDLEAFWDFSSVEALQPDRNEMVKSGAIAISSGQYTINEWREQILDLGKIPGGDVLMVGRNVVPLEIAIQPPEPKPDPNKPGDSEDPADDEEPAEDDAGKSVRHKRGTSAIAKAMEEIRGARIVTVRSRADDEFHRIWRSQLARAEDDLASMLRQDFGRLNKEITARIKQGLDSNLEGDLRRIWLVDKKGAHQKRVMGSFKKQIRDWGNIYLEHAHVETAFDLPIDREIRILRSRTNDVLTSQKSKWIKVRKALIEGMSETETGVQGVAEKIASVINQEAKLSPYQIARTHMTSALNAGSQEMAMESANRGINIRHTWSTNMDGKAREWHEDENGTTIDPVTETFVVNGESLQYPGDPAGSPDNVIACRCGMRPSVANR